MFNSYSTRSRVAIGAGIFTGVSLAAFSLRGCKHEEAPAHKDNSTTAQPLDSETLSHEETKGAPDPSAIEQVSSAASRSILDMQERCAQLNIVLNKNELTSADIKMIHTNFRALEIDCTIVEVFTLALEKEYGKTPLSNSDFASLPQGNRFDKLPLSIINSNDIERMKSINYSFAQKSLRLAACGLDCVNKLNKLSSDGKVIPFDAKTNPELVSTIKKLRESVDETRVLVDASYDILSK